MIVVQVLREIVSSGHSVLLGCHVFLVNHLDASRCAVEEGATPHGGDGEPGPPGCLPPPQARRSSEWRGSPTASIAVWGAPQVGG